MTALDDLVLSINKKVGEQILFRGSALKNKQILRCTTGSLAFDLALGGGWPLNVWNEIIGNESQGKTVMALKTIAACQALDKKHETLWIAAEGFTLEWAEALGVDLDRVVIAETRVMEEAYQAVVDALDKRACDAIVIDSYPALTPTIEDEKLMEEMSVGLGAKLTNQFMRKSNKAGRRSLVEDDRTCLGLLINQWRERIGVIRGDPRTTPGGKGKNFAAFTRVEVSRDEWIEVQGEKVGLSIKIRTIKNKTAPPQRSGIVDFYFEDSIPFHKGDYDLLKEISNIAIAEDIVERKGSWYHFGGEQWQGKEGVLDALRQDLDLQKKIKGEVFRIVLKQPIVTPVSQAPRKATTAPPSKADTTVRSRIKR